MIKTGHPVLDALAEMPQVFIPTGSRYLGTNENHSDYDFFVAIDKKYGDEGKKFMESMVAMDFKVHDCGGGYGPDDSLHWLMSWQRRKDSYGVDQHGVDVLVADSKEIAVRVAVFEALKKLAGNWQHGKDVKKMMKSVKGSNSTWRVIYALAKEFGNELG